MPRYKLMVHSSFLIRYGARGGRILKLVKCPSLYFLVVMLVNRHNDGEYKYPSPYQYLSVTLTPQTWKGKKKWNSILGSNAHNRRCFRCVHRWARWLTKNFGRDNELKIASFSLQGGRNQGCRAGARAGVNFYRVKRCFLLAPGLRSPDFQGKKESRKEL